MDQFKEDLSKCSFTGLCIHRMEEPFKKRAFSCVLPQASCFLSTQECGFQMTTPLQTWPCTTTLK